MMDCRRFRESLDPYVDGELSAEAQAAADAHRRECPRCGLVARELEALRQAIRVTVDAAMPPAGLDERVRASLGLAAGSAAGAARLNASRWIRLAAAAMLLAAIGLTGSALVAGRLRNPVAAFLDRAVTRLSTAQPVSMLATVLCRDCELQDRHGEPALCDRYGHRGALVTSDGRIWNIMEQEVSLPLVRDEAMLGQTVRVQGTLYRDAGTIAVDHYELVRTETAILTEVLRIAAF